MDPRSPTTGEAERPTCGYPGCVEILPMCRNATSPCKMFEGENLRRERLSANQPFAAAPWEIGKAIALICIIGLAWFVACAFQVEMPV